jgi:hypothetical protein
MRVISNFFKICGDIRKRKCTTGINDTGGKFATMSTKPMENLSPAANFANRLLTP